MSLSLLARAIRMVLGWRLRGLTWPHPFFARETRAPIYPVAVLSPPPREALRPLCGPHPTAEKQPPQFRPIADDSSNGSTST
jgi:hypothetical protein